ncbi:MAG: nucleotidyltransferase domain-containing protein [Deltaproteobacteria bacterium]|nr:nucleotidyltransferase domain-containing protein [Deltaproteobacteria bacterium]
MENAINLESLKERARRWAENHPGVSLVYLFGSQATGQTGPESDIDIGVLLDRDLENPETQAVMHYELARLLKTGKVDLIWLRQAPMELAFAVISQGRLLYERDVAHRVEYESYVMGRYYDYLPILRAQRDEILAGGNFDRRVQWHREAFKRTERTLGQIRAAPGKKSG